MPQVVFATAFDQYAVRAFEVNAVDYLLKPFDRKRVLQDDGEGAGADAGAGQAGQSGTDAKLDALLKLVEEQAQPAEGRARARWWCGRRAGCCWWTRGRSASRRSRRATIMSVTHGGGGQSNCRTLEELMDQLDPETFWRAHRSFLVNIQHIREVVPWFKSSYQLRMDDPKKTEIPVSRDQTKRLRELFNL